MMEKYLTKKEFDKLVGSWHPNSFHGHFRSKSRIELSNLYRQSAKPVPPEKFMRRQIDDATKHNFSIHDNRQNILNDPLLFGSGLGKKKIESVNKSKWNPEFITWCEESGRDRFKKTIYQRDFCLNSNQNKKLLTARSNIERPISMYSMSFSNQETTIDDYKQVRHDTYQRFIKKNRAKTCLPGERTSVASCMVWCDKIQLPKQAENIQSDNI
ncbi:unnamed protein product [Brachionus calyciflorus]|uniref:Domain of unknown function with conserved HDNR motif domain-containing protein n=1 Tax=Brachionus calyciflorus TaxID=104777 RepID=A0A814GF51_9BILA|nr:unnamed protein product [Brachionus calyciflorus]